MPPKTPKQKKQLPASLSGNISLQSYNDYVNLVETLVNGVLHGEIERQVAHTCAVLTGYGLNALREAHGGKTQISVFLQNMNQVKVESLSQEQMTRFLQGDEETQFEILKEAEKDGVIETTATVVVPKAPIARLETKLIAQMAGTDQDTIKEVLMDGKTVEEIAVPVARHPVHEWEKAAGGKSRFCTKCGAERVVLQQDDMTAVCSEDWGLV